MALQLLHFLLIISSFSLISLSLQDQNQSLYFTLMKQSLFGKSLSRWNSGGNSGNFYCNYAGIECNDHGFAVKIDLSKWSLSGRIPANICSYLPELRVLRLDHNNLEVNFPVGLDNCSLLEELNLSWLNLAGTVPDLSRLKSLRLLDLSYNNFTGEFPVCITNLTNLEYINLNENPGFGSLRLPETFTRLTKLKTMILSTCSVTGQIPAWMGNMTSLVNLQLSGNFLVGQIPAELGKLKDLKMIELYYNQLTGDIPDELGNLTQLTDIDASVNRLTGAIPESLCALPNLRVLQFYNNSLSGEIPRVLGNSTTLRDLSLYENSLTGELPPNLGQFSNLTTVDLSENGLFGELPPEICRGGQLMYFLVLDNFFSGKLPENYATCNSLIRFRVSNNRLHGSIPEGLFSLPHVSIMDLGFNCFDGPIAGTIQNAKNLSTLIIQSNRISGILPQEISQASNLVKIDLSNNFISGPIPSNIGDLKKLNLLNLQYNRLVSSIPDSLSSLKSLDVLNLSNNLLTGRIPEKLCKLLPTSLDFSNNKLSGPVPLPLIRGGLAESLSGNPGLCVSAYLSWPTETFPICPQTSLQKRVSRAWVISISLVIVFVGILLFLKRWFSREKVVTEQDALSSSSSFSYDVKSFHKLTFDQREIVDALINKNIVGHGGSGTVYRIELSHGETVAVKKLWPRKTKDPSSDDFLFDKELKTEVDTLGSIRHKNIVKLYCCFSNSDSNLLVYEYMPNGNLWDALHKGKSGLDWPTRHKIALGVAQGMAYLHHDLLPPIIHRDIKSTNILLDAEFQPKVADFGIAKVLQARRDSTTTVIAGTYGYLAPEYAYSPKATIKCDVYSFGVVLMELITGRKPIEAEFGENKNIIFWVSCKAATKEGAMEVLDKRLEGLFKDEMIRVLRIAIRCTCKAPSLRPTMTEVAQLLIEADPCRYGECKSSNKLKEPLSTIKDMNPS